MHGQSLVSLAQQAQVLLAGSASSALCFVADMASPQGRVETVGWTLCMEKPSWAGIQLVAGLHKLDCQGIRTLEASWLSLKAWTQGCWRNER